MTSYLYIATAMGLFIATQTNGNWQVVNRPLADRPFTSISASGSMILAGTAEGIWRSADGGQSWTQANDGLTIGHVRWLAHGSDATGPLFLAGTEPAGIFVSRDGGRSWSGRPEVEQLRDKHGWYLPYSPEAGCVRGFTAAKGPSAANRIYAAVEVGGVLVSDDNGDNWRLVHGSDGSPRMARDLGSKVHPDVHSITVHPSSPDLVTAATGGGLYRSTDGGRSWQLLYSCYIRAVWVDPTDPRRLIAGPADGVSANGRIEASSDGGQSWHPASDGMTPAPWPRHMVERFFQLDAALFAVLSNGELWSMPVSGSTWRRVAADLPRVTAAAGSRR